MEEFQIELKRMFTEFSSEIESEKWVAKERELVSRFAFSKLVKNIGCCELFYDSAQISIETRVAQILSGINFRQKKQICKDLIIWKNPNQNYWSKPNIPLCIIEWKHNLLKPNNADINWLISYTKKFPECFGIVSNVDILTKYGLQAVLIENGNISDMNWINL